MPNTTDPAARPLARYREMLEEHDWDFEYSDDQRVWRIGRLALTQLRLLQQELDPDFAIWNAYAPAAHRRGPVNPVLSAPHQLQP